MVVGTAIVREEINKPALAVPADSRTIQAAGGTNDVRSMPHPASLARHTADRDCSASQPFL
jgi:hypothetical protein